MRDNYPNKIILRNRYGDSEEVELQRAHNTTIGYVVNGKLVIHTHAGIIQIYTGELFILPCGLHFVEHFTMEQRLYEEILFAPSEGLFATILKELQLFSGVRPLVAPQAPSSQYPHQRADRAIISLISGIREYLNGDIFERCGDMERMKTNELVYLLLGGDYGEMVATLQHLSTHKRLPIEQFAKENILSTKRIEELAREYGVSLSGFKKEFHKALGQTPHSWMMERRLEMAAGLLKSTSQQIKAIAHECHFATSSHFIRLFHKKYHCTPLEYRTRAQNEGLSTRREIKNPSDNIKNI